MAVQSTATPVAETATSWENPLIPNRKLRELYTAMVELRLLEEHVARLQRRAKASVRLQTGPGDEGCRVSTVLSLASGDVTSDARPGVATDFLRGAKLADLLHRVYALGSGALKSDSAKPLAGVPVALPSVEDTSSRLHVCLGAALSLPKQKTNKSLIVAYVHGGDLSLPQWKPFLRLAAQLAAPILLVALPGSQSLRDSLKPGELSHVATGCGVPGIPVDAADPIALYRVAQESMLRARAGGGPVLMECIPFQLPGKKTEPGDPILTMRQSLLHRNLATEAWLEGVAVRFAARLAAADR
jgi:TPP-dependent pyruvate/acetoin dehydrogenase alpha subunit